MPPITRRSFLTTSAACVASLSALGVQRSATFGKSHSVHARAEAPGG